MGGVSYGQYNNKGQGTMLEKGGKEAPQNNLILTNSTKADKRDAEEEEEEEEEEE